MKVTKRQRIWTITSLPNASLTNSPPHSQLFEQDLGHEIIINYLFAYLLLIIKVATHSLATLVTHSARSSFNIFKTVRPRSLLVLAVPSFIRLSRSQSNMAPSSQDPSNHTKAVIIGSGPAGHTAAIYLARAEVQPTMYEGMLANGIAAGGQLTTTTEIENFPGFPKGIMGATLMDQMREQSLRFGTKIVTETVSKLDLSERPFKFWLEFQEDEPPRTADVVILATGASAKRLHLPGEETYWQAGVSACAVCDGAVPIFRHKPLVVVGGGDSAAEESLFLTKYASKVTVLVRKDKLRASPIMAKRLLSHPKVEVLFHHEAVEVKGDGKLMNKLTIVDNRNGEKRDLTANGLFYAIGHNPATSLVRSQVETDSDGYVMTKPGSAETSIKGFFAAGDVQDKRYRQAITSAGTGCMAAMEAEKLLADEEVN